MIRNTIFMVLNFKHPLLQSCSLLKWNIKVFQINVLSTGCPMFTATVRQNKWLEECWLSLLEGSWSLSFFSWFFYTLWKGLEWCSAGSKSGAQEVKRKCKSFWIKYLQIMLMLKMSQVLTLGCFLQHKRIVLMNSRYF